MEKLVFAFTPAAGEPEEEIIMLVGSIRQFSGSLAEKPVYLLIQANEDCLSSSTLTALSKWDVKIIPFQIEPEFRQFPFAAKVFASAAAEKIAKRSSEILVWLDPDTLFIQEPTDFLLPDYISLAARPVMHTLIGSPVDQPVDKFWQFIYTKCKVGSEQIFTVHTPVDSNELRAYFNAGLLVLRPKAGILARWQKNFRHLYRHSYLKSLYLKNRLYQVFIHQAVLTGSILSLLKPEEITIFSELYNYPLLLHSKMPQPIRINRLNEAVTCRYDQFSLFQKPDWDQMIPIEEPLSGWLNGLLEKRPA